MREKVDERVDGSIDDAIQRLTDVSLDCVQGLIIASQKAEALGRTLETLPTAVAQHLTSAESAVASIKQNVLALGKELRDDLELAGNDAKQQVEALRGSLTESRKRFEEIAAQELQALAENQKHAEGLMLLAEKRLASRVRSMRIELRVCAFIIAALVLYHILQPALEPYVRQLWK